MSEEWIAPGDSNVAPGNNIVEPPMFLGEKERDFQKQVGDEVLDVMNQWIIYHAIDFANTVYHPLYGEAIKKTFFPPVHVKVAVNWKGEETTQDQYDIDKRPKIEVSFAHRRLTEDLGLMVREGDFLQYGRDFYEITKLNEDKELFGQFRYKVEVVATCTKSRQNVFNAD
jgi:hypothetical protein